KPIAGSRSLSLVRRTARNVGSAALERQSYSQSAPPNNPAPLLARPVEQLKPVREIAMFFHLNACSARGVVNQNAFNDGQFRPENDLGRARNPARRTDALKQALVLHGRIL